MQKIYDLRDNLIQSILIAICRFITGVIANSHTDLTKNKTRIYYANHSSHLDALVIYSCLPKSIRKNLTPIGAIDYWNKNKLTRYLANNIFNVTLIDRFYDKNNSTSNTDPHPIEIINQQLNQGKSILIFPEGTRSEDEEIKPFKSGLYYIAKQNTSAEIIPVYLENLNRVLPKGGHLLVPIICRVIFGKVLPSPGEQEDKYYFLNRAKLELEELKFDFTR